MSAVGIRSRDGRPNGVKHLNPRQGITTEWGSLLTYPYVPFRVKHLNPRQGITTHSHHPLPRPPSLMTMMSVKHLNPRQGITTSGRLEA